MKKYIIGLSLLLAGCMGQDIQELTVDGDPPRFISFLVYERIFYESIPEYIGVGSSLLLYDLSDSSHSRILEEVPFNYTWSSRGKLAYVEDFNSTLIIEDFAAGRTVTEFEIQEQDVSGIAWSEDGHKIVFSGRSGNIHVLDVNSGEIEVAVAIGPGDSLLHSPRFSPDNSKLFYQVGLTRLQDGRNYSTSDFFVADLKQGVTTAPRFDTRVELRHDINVPHFYDWTPNSQSLVYGQSGRLLEYNLLNSDLRQITTSNESVLNGSLSPSGQAILYKLSFAYTDDIGYHDEQTLFKVNFDGTGREKLLDTVQGDWADWSRDSNQITISNKNGIYIVNYHSREVVQIVDVLDATIRRFEETEALISNPVWVY